MQCSRCNKKLIEGKNIHKNWHIPMCTSCRRKHLGNEWKLTKGEENIMKMRLSK
jgi:NMD protein affecting ribosome stability and mRNA decay